MAIVRGKHVKIRMISADGELLETWNPQSATFGDEDNKERQERLGEDTAKPRQTLVGHTGTLEFEVESPALMDIHDSIIEAAKRGDGTVYFDIIRTVRFPKSGQTRTYAYPDVVISFEENASARNDAVTTSLTWSSSLRVLL